MIWENKTRQEIKRYQDWHLWFAWYKVPIGDFYYRWEWVWRRGVLRQGESLWWDWEYHEVHWGPNGRVTM